MGFSALAAFLVITRWGGIAAAVLTAAATVAAVLLLAVPRLRRQRALLLIAIPVILAAGRYWWVEQTVFAPAQQYADYTGTLTVQITGEATAYARSTRYPAVVTAGEVPAGTPLYLWITDQEVVPRPYDLVTGEIQFRPEEEGYVLTNRADGVALSGLLRSWKGADVQTPGRLPWQATLWHLRRGANDTVGRYLFGERAAMIRGVCLGDRRGLSQSLRDAFQDTGAAHLLVVSGLHLGIIVAAMWGLLRRLRLSRRLTALLTIPVLIGFMLIIGFTPSIRRAGVMALVMLVAPLFKREADGLNTLGLALVLLAFTAPYAVWDAGLQLSVGATAGILLFYPRIDAGMFSRRWAESRFLRWIRRPVRAAAVTLSATTALTPLLTWYYGRISLVFLPANLLMIFPATVAVIAGWIGILTGGWFPFAARAAFAVAGTMADWLRTVVVWLKQLPLATVSVRVPFFWVWMLLAALMLALLWKRLRNPGRVTAVSATVIALMLGCVTYQIASRPVTAYTVWQTDGGTAVLAQWSEGSALIARGKDADLLRAVRMEMDRRGIERLSVAVFPDLNGRTLDGLPGLAFNWPIERVLTPEDGLYDASVRQLFDAGQLIMAEGSVVRVGADHEISLSHDIVTLTAGQTRLVIAAAPDDTADATILTGEDPRITFAAGENIPLLPDQIWQLTTRGQRDFYAQ